MNSSGKRNEVVVGKALGLLKRPLLLAFSMGIVESLLFLIGGLPAAVQRTGALALTLLPFMCGMVWFPLFLILHLVLRKRSGSMGKLAYMFVRVLAVLSLFFIFLINLSSWYFFLKTGMFLNVDLLNFGLENMGAIQLHFLQTAAYLWMGLTVVALIGAIVMVSMLSVAGILGRRVERIVLETILALFVICASIQLIDVILRPGRQPFQPMVALFAGESNQLDTGTETTAMPPLRKKTGPYNPKLSSKQIPENPVIVLMVESMRRDLKEVEPSPIPFMKSLVDRSIFFDKAYTPASHSNYADLSVWYSQYPQRTRGVNRYSEDDLWRGTPVFRVFQSLGYHTAYISSQNEKWGGMIHWLKVQSVDYFYHSEDYEGKTWVNADDAPGLVALIKSRIATAGKIEDSETLRICTQWMDSLPDNKPFFLGVNLQNTHFNYVIPKGGKEPFQPSTIDFPTVYYAWPKGRVVDVRNRYYNAFYNLDGIIHDFVDNLKRKGIWDRCWFLIIGDSGEAFYEHGFGNHSGPMYEEAMRTFCLMKPPRGVPSEVVEQPINLIDIFPALLDKMNIPMPGSFQGVSPFHTPPLRSNVYLHTHAIVQQDGLLRWPWKFLLTSSPRRMVELYNLDIDPKEQKNLYRNYPQRAGEMFQDLMRWKKIQIQYYSDPNIYGRYNPPRYLDTSAEPAN